MLRAEAFAKADDLDLALNIIDATVDLAPDEAEAWHLGPRCITSRRTTSSPSPICERVLERDAKHYAALNDLGVVLEAIGAKKEALEAYRQALADQSVSWRDRAGDRGAGSRSRRPGYLTC